MTNKEKKDLFLGFCGIIVLAILGSAPAIIRSHQDSKFIEVCNTLDVGVVVGIIPPNYRIHRKVIVEKYEGGRERHISNTAIIGDIWEEEICNKTEKSLAN